MARVLIVGYGNPLRGDDGVGWHAVERLRKMVDDPAIEILAVHQLTPELMDPMSRASLVIFIDAAERGEPGEIRERRVEPASSHGQFTHRFTPESLVEGAGRLFGRAPETWIVTVTAVDFSISESLSAIVENRLQEVTERSLRLAGAAL